MNYPWKIWLGFAVCLGVVLTALGWVSGTVLRLDQVQAQAEQQAEFEEKIRLALWRMDSSLTPLIVEESARPYVHYQVFHTAETALTKGLGSFKEVLIPSPLLNFTSSNVLLHFQVESDGRLTSPQAPLGKEFDLAVNKCTTAASVQAAAGRLAQLGKILAEKAHPFFVQAAGGPRGELSNDQLSNGDFLLSAVPERTNIVPIQTINAPIQEQQMRQQSELQQPGANLKVSQIPSQRAQIQSLRNSAEWNARANVYQQAAQTDVPLGPYLQSPDLTLSEGPLKPLWLGSALVLARRVQIDGRTLIQGAWLDWAYLKQGLLDNVRDLFPGADLEPMISPGGERDARMLAALPAKLTAVHPAPVALPLWTPIRMSLALAWLCVLLAGLAVAVLLHGTLSLSERRGAFVSAVTHELRTPLTTFKMYSEMLAEDMVPDPEKRRHYLQTLCAEANRLSHLVENVLAYARLERGSARRRIERVSLGNLIERVKPRLLQRAEQSGLKLVEDSEAGTLATVVSVDVSAVEQILFNLVDNACKYAGATATEKLIHLDALPDGKFAMLRVRDHGQGISAAGARRLFKPFSKSASEAAQTAPGVGLGLALCRRLSRSMGGDLHLDTLTQSGACFVLTLPVHPS
jgi:signal transduction histidine kinase